MTIPAPHEDPLAYDCPVIAGQRWPGVAEVKGCDRSWDWEVKKAKGKDGASTALQGGELAKPKITFVLWKGWDGPLWVDYFEEWESFKTVFDKTVDDKNPEAVVIEHPQFAHNKIRAVVMTKMGDLEFERDGRAKVVVELLEYRKAKKSGGGVKSAGKGDKGGKKDRVKSDAELEAERLELENSMLLEQLKK